MPSSPAQPTARAPCRARHARLQRRAGDLVFRHCSRVTRRLHLPCTTRANPAFAHVGDASSRWCRTQLTQHVSAPNCCAYAGRPQRRMVSVEWPSIATDARARLAQTAPLTPSAFSTLRPYTATFRARRRDRRRDPPRFAVPPHVGDAPCRPNRPADRNGRARRNRYRASVHPPSFHQQRRRSGPTSPGRIPDNGAARSGTPRAQLLRSRSPTGICFTLLPLCLGSCSCYHRVLRTPERCRWPSTPAQSRARARAKGERGLIGPSRPNTAVPWPSAAGLRAASWC